VQEKEAYPISGRARTGRGGCWGKKTTNHPGKARNFKKRNRWGKKEGGGQQRTYIRISLPTKNGKCKKFPKESAGLKKRELDLLGQLGEGTREGMERSMVKQSRFKRRSKKGEFRQFQGGFRSHNVHPTKKEKGGECLICTQRQVDGSLALGGGRVL